MSPTNGLDFLLGDDDETERRPAPSSTYRFGTITGIDPLRIRLDGDDADLASTPIAVSAAPLGARVWTQLHGTQLVILGAVQTESGAVILPDRGTNLDNYTQTGAYHQSANAGAASGQNYPSPHAGLLTVTRVLSGSTEFVYQTYHNHSNAQIYARTRYNRGAWAAWKALI